jgi:hypothetical protein
MDGEGYAMTAADLQLAIAAAELAARLLPGIITIGENIYVAIQSHGELTPEQKAALRARVEATAALVAAYQPRPPPDPDATPPD